MGTLHYTDTYRHKGLRKQLVSVLKAKDIKDQKVLNAISELPRHWFLDRAFEEWAYRDRPFAIGAGQTISTPYTVAFQSQLLKIKKNDKVLEVGTGSGYQACILQKMGARVFSIERQAELYYETKTRMQKIGFEMVRIMHGDGFLGWPTEAMFDKIIITAGAPKIPSRLVDQLKWGGRMVIPVGNLDQQKMLLIKKDQFGRVTCQKFGNFAFVPMLNNTVKLKSTDL